MQHSILEDLTERQQLTALSKRKLKESNHPIAVAMQTALYQLTVESASDGCAGHNKWVREDISPSSYDLSLQKVPSVRWAGIERDDSAESSNSDSDNVSIISDSIISDNNCTKLDANNSGQGIDMLNMPSAAETVARQKSWIQIYFRYRIQWFQAKPHLEKMTKAEAYKPENLNLWTRYVKVSQQRKVPFMNSVRAFRNRIQCPGINMRYTLNSFYRKGSETEKAKNCGPLHPVMLPQFRSPDDIPEFRKLPVAIINVFVTTEDTFFDDFWKESAGAQHH